MEASKTRVVSAVADLLAAPSHDCESQALATLHTIISAPAIRNEWLAWMAKVGYAEPLLMYCLHRSFAPGAEMATVFKADRAEGIHRFQVFSRKPECAINTASILHATTESMWTTQALGVLRSVIQTIEDPRVRQQAIQFTYSMLSKQMKRADEAWIQATGPVLLLGVTDLWSAIRKESARRVLDIVSLLTSPERIDHFIDSLLKTAATEPWTTQEGALLALDAIVASIQSTSQASVPAERTALDMIKGGGTSDTSTTYTIGGANAVLPHLPRSITIKLKPTIYQSLKHSQLGVREVAAQCLAHYIKICDESTRILTFQEVMSKLNRLSPTEPVPQSTGANGGAHPELLEAAEAEGLLDVLTKMIPFLPMPFLVKHWKFVFPTLERYVMHIASSVRLKASGIVLALAEISRCTSNNADAMELLYQMLLALSEHRADVGVCWQRFEGRLLSVDLLVNFVGKDLLFKTNPALLHFQSRPRKRPAAALSQLFILPESNMPQATWTVDEDEEKLLDSSPRPSQAVSVMQALESHLQSKQVASPEFWRRVLGCWCSQTREAFESTQFELRRIARQVLPGLVRVSVWCGQISIVDTILTSRADAKTDTDTAQHEAWTWVCMRHALLHIQLIRETMLNDGRARELIQSADPLCNQIAHCEKCETQNDLEAAVAKVESIALAALTTKTVGRFSQQLRDAVAVVYSALPTLWHHASVKTNQAARLDGTLDRQFSIALAQVLPAIVDQCFQDTQDELQLCWMLERIALSWLASGDMFRWITVSKVGAHCALLGGLCKILNRQEAEQLMKVDGDLIFRTVDAVAPCIAVQKDALCASVVDIFITLWKTVETEKLRSKIMVNLARMNQAPQSTHSKAAPQKSNWDDWDSDGGDVASGNDKDEELLSSLPPDPAIPRSWITDLLATRLSTSELQSFQAALDEVITSQDHRCHGCGALVDLAAAIRVAT